MRYFKVLAVVTILCGTGCKYTDNPVARGDNSDPVITAVTIIPETVRTGESCIIRCEATDSDNDNLEYEWEAGLGSISGNGSEVFYTASGCCASPFLYVTVKDRKGGEITQQIIVPLRLD